MISAQVVDPTSTTTTIPSYPILYQIIPQISFYDSVYPGRGIISMNNKNLFDGWNQSDPVDEWECERARRIEKIQGNRNKVVMVDC